jgi:GDPmannose 4,6-dehydratase
MYRKAKGNENRIDHGDLRPGRRLSDQAAAGKGLSGARRIPAHQLGELLAAGELELGNLGARRDRGLRRGIHRTHVADAAGQRARTFVLATGRTETVRDFATLAFKAAGIGIEWKGKGEGETGIRSDTDQTVVRINPKFYRPAEVEMLIGDAAHACEVLGWQANTSLEELCRMTVETDLKRVERGVPF